VNKSINSLQIHNIPTLLSDNCFDATTGSSLDETTETTSCNAIIMEVFNQLESAGWNFNHIKEDAEVFPDLSTSHERKIKPPGGRGSAPSWDLNYPALTYLMNGQYYSDYSGVFGMLGLPVMSEKRWLQVVAWLGRHVENLANSSCQQVRQVIIDRGDKKNWTASYDGFYLTRGHHSNNSSGTLHDVVTDKIAWFAHRTKRGSGANWEGTSAGAEGDMLRGVLKAVKADGFKVHQIVMDHDSSAGNIVCEAFPEVRISYCGNHTAKTFHRDLVKIKSIRCKVSILQSKGKMVIFGNMHT